MSQFKYTELTTQNQVELIKTKLRELERDHLRSTISGSADIERYERQIQQCRDLLEGLKNYNDELTNDQKRGIVANAAGLSNVHGATPQVNS